MSFGAGKLAKTVVWGALGLMAALALFAFVQYRFSDEYQLRREVEHIKKEAAQDPYGGDTPGETLRLFIDALKKGDTDLAAKYFVMDEQERWREDLREMSPQDLDALASDLQQATKTKEGGDVARFEYKRKFEGSTVAIQGKQFPIEAGAVNQPADLVRALNGKWKILDL